MCDCSKGNTAWGKFGAKVGDSVWNKAAKMTKSWTGFGDYNIVGNSLIEQGGGDMQNVKISTQGRGTRVQFREYIGDVTTVANGPFNARTFYVNPANIITFPWLSAIAQQYEQYVPNGMIFEFKGTASDNSVNINLGSIMMAADYDVNDKDYSTKQEMMNSAYASEGKISDDMLHGIECDPNELQRKVFYTRALSENVGKSRDYDVCKFTVATSGNTTGGVIGSLYVHYDFTFYKEQVSNGVAGGSLPNAVYGVNSAGVEAGVTGFDGLLNGTLRDDLKVGASQPTLITGTDLGILVDGWRILIPNKWKDSRMLFTFDITVFNGITWTQGAITSITEIGVDIVPAPDCFLQSDNVVLNQFNIDAGGTSGARFLVELKNVNLDGYMAINFVPHFQPWPAAVITAPYKAAMSVQLVDNTFWE